MLPDLTTLLRVHLLGAAGEGLVSWPASCAASSYMAAASRGLPSPSLKSLVTGTVRDTWQAFLTSTLETTAHDISWMTLVSLAWIVMESSALCVCQQLQVRARPSTASLPQSAQRLLPLDLVPSHRCSCIKLPVSLVRGAVACTRLQVHDSNTMRMPAGLGAGSSSNGASS